MSIPFIKYRKIIGFSDFFKQLWFFLNLSYDWLFIVLVSLLLLLFKKSDQKQLREGRAYVSSPFQVTVRMSREWGLDTAGHLSGTT